MTRVGAWMIAGVLLAAGCSDEAGPGTGSAGTGPSLENRDAGTSGAGATGEGARSGSAGTAGRRNDEAGRGGTSGQAGSRAQSGSGAAGSGAAGSSGRSAGGSGVAGVPAAGMGGAAGASEVSDTCASDADCEMCTTPLGPEENCCPGCPTPHTKERCAAERLAASMCKAAKLPARPIIPVCPSLLCIEPGEALCMNGICVRSDAIR